MEIWNLDGQKQFDTLIQANLKYILTDFAEVLRPLTLDDVDALNQSLRRQAHKSSSLIC